MMPLATSDGPVRPVPGADWPVVPLVSLNVAQPGLIGTLRNGEPVVSGIAKLPVVATTLFLGALNLEGDRQADLLVHGGPDKAVYAYPSEHLPSWNTDLGVDPPFTFGTFGENLSTSGWLENDVFIGDVWSWGEALLQVSQPRSPCYKLALVTGRLDLPRRLIMTGRTGWYLRVLRPGDVPVDGPIHVISRHPAGVTVLDAHLATLPGRSLVDIQRVAAVNALARGWLS